jgi:hypothetical protein
LSRAAAASVIDTKSALIAYMLKCPASMFTIVFVASYPCSRIAVMVVASSFISAAMSACNWRSRGNWSALATVAC